MSVSFDKPFGISGYEGLSNILATIALGLFVLSILWVGLNPIDAAEGVFEAVEAALKWSYRILLIPALLLQTYTLRRMLPMLAVLALFGMVAVTSGDPTCLLVFAILVACRNIDPMYLIKVYLRLALAFLGLLLVLHIVALTKPVYIQRGMDPFARTSLGLVHPNKLGALFLSLGVAWLVVRYRTFGVKDALPIVFLTIANALVCDSRTTTLVLSFALLSVAGVKVAQRRFGVNLIPFLAVFVLIVSSAFIILVVAYDPSVSWMVSIDNLLSSRLYNCNLFFERYQPWLFGRDVTALPVSYVYQWTGEEVRFLVDNSVFRSLIAYGIPATIVMLAGVVASGVKVYKTEAGEAFAFGLCMMALAGIMESTFFSIDTNPCLVIISSAMLMDRRAYKSKHMRSNIYENRSEHAGREH